MKAEIGHDGDKEFVEFDGHRYSLGLIPDTEPVVCTPMSQIIELRDRETLKGIVQSGFQSGRNHFDGSWTKDQNGWGKCASSAATYAVEKVRHLNGHPRVPLSDDYLYSLVNDGRDRGSTLGENLRAITERGIATRATVPEGAIYRNKYNRTVADKEALRFRAWEGYAVNSEQEVINAIVNNFMVVIAIHVGRNWQKFDKDGVLIGDRGMGNHCEHLDDVRYNPEKSRFEFRKHSSHSRSYGDQGFCWVTYDKHLATVHSSHQKYAVGGVIQDPKEDGQEGWEDDTPLLEPTLVVTSGSHCSWCRKWDKEDRDKVGKHVKIESGSVPGSGVPRFKLKVGEKSKIKVGYWSAREILAEVANLQAASIIG